MKSRGRREGWQHPNRGCLPAPDRHPRPSYKVAYPPLFWDSLQLNNREHIILLWELCLLKHSKQALMSNANCTPISLICTGVGVFVCR